MFDDMVSSWHSCAGYDKHVCATHGTYARGVSTNLTLLLSSRVREMMRRRDWSQEETAKRANVSRRSVGYLLNYRDRSDRHPTLETVEALASAFHTPAWKLLAPGDVGASRVAEPVPLDAELLATVLMESADIFRTLNVLPRFDELAKVAVRMYDEVQTGIPMRRAAKIVAETLEHAKRGMDDACADYSSAEDATRGQSNQGPNRGGKAGAR
jgi:transcriptional regulator with XRE-family HTH domain